MFGHILPCSNVPESTPFNWHNVKLSVHDWFINFAMKAWEDEWYMIENGIYDDETYFNDLADEYWRAERAQSAKLPKKKVIAIQRVKKNRI